MEHRYSIDLDWTGNTGSGTAGYRAYERAYRIDAVGHPSIFGSSDPAFRGDSSCWNPEELFIASISSCHQLWYLHLCTDAGIVVVSYSDHAEGVMIEDRDGSGRFSEVVLRPKVAVEPGSDRNLALRLHAEANAKCFIANSLNFRVLHEPTISFA
jgi:organic hydroperoxide reductase OsmC/OhrA